MPLAPRNRQLFCIGAGLVLAACASHSSAAPGDDAQACAPDVADHDSAVTHSYAVVHGWPELSEGFVLGQVSGVAIDSHRHVFVFHRADHPWLDAPGTTVITAPTLLRLSADTGRIEASLGAGMFVVPHGLRIDAHDHLWVTDVGLHQVFELDHDGTVLRSFGTAGVPGADATHFDQPTDVAVAPDGGFYVSDGYGNSR
ncbi:MAG TPA: hypothetical protein VHM19_09865, partial [Polyangiales bacterium]|nr:hypothetical protein [Polyangiales bacterium]